jgi:hypothetical protein
MEKFTLVMKDKLSKFIPSAFNRALCSYRTFTQQNTDMETKEFSAYHSACKNALSHIDNLIKLSKIADNEETNESDRNEELQNLLIAAKEELAQI